MNRFKLILKSGTVFKFEAEKGRTAWYSPEDELPSEELFIDYDVLINYDSIAVAMLLPESPEASEDGFEQRPALIDRDGDRWVWGGMRYVCLAGNVGLATPGEVAEMYGPVTEVPLP